MSKAKYYYKKMREYERAEKSINSYLEMLNSNLSQCEDVVSDFPSVYNPDSNIEGQVIDDFYTKSEKFYRELTDILDKAKSSRDTIKGKKEQAHAEYLYYRELWEGGA